MLDPLELIQIFYRDAAECCQLTAAEEIPAAYRALLSHDDHMTVTVEAFHDSLVDVEVLDQTQDDTHYARKILLRRRSDGQVVQFGIVRLALGLLADDVRTDIISKQTPLGRILIKHHVMRRVAFDSLWTVTPGADLSKHFRSDEPTYGRTAWIHVNGNPAVELLEVVTPISES